VSEPTEPVRVSAAAKRELELLLAELRQKPGHGRLTLGGVVEVLLAERKAAGGAVPVKFAPPTPWRPS
jgi:hypothetical protein